MLHLLAQRLLTPHTPPLSPVLRAKGRVLTLHAAPESLPGAKGRVRLSLSPLYFLLSTLLFAFPAQAYWETPTLELYDFHRPVVSGRWLAWGERVPGNSYGVIRAFDTVTLQFLQVNVLDTPNPDDLVPDTVLLTASTTYHPGFAFVGDTLYWSDRQPGQTAGNQLRGRNLLDLVSNPNTPIIAIPSDAHSNDYRFPNASGSRLAWTAFNYNWVSPSNVDHFGRAGLVRDLDTQTNRALIEYTNHATPIPDVDGPRAIWTNSVGNNTDGFLIEPAPRGIYFQLLEPDPDVPDSTDPRLLYPLADNEFIQPAILSSQHVVWSDRLQLDPNDSSNYVNRLMHYDLATDEVEVLVDDLGPMTTANYALSGDILVYEVARELVPDDLSTVQRDIHVMELRTPERRSGVFADSDYDESVPWVDNGNITWYERRATETSLTQIIYWTRLAVPCDFNLDGMVNVQDINPFILALADINAFHARYSAAYALLTFLDPNADGLINVQDINPFIQALAYSGASVESLNLVIPEPSAVLFLPLALTLLSRRNTKHS